MQILMNYVNSWLSKDSIRREPLDELNDNGMNECVYPESIYEEYRP